MRTAALWTFKVIVAVLLFAFIALACLRLAAAWRESADASPPSDGRMVSTANGEIFVQVRGPDSGVPVILVPGTAAWSGFWLGVADDLGADGYRAVAVDLPPFGFSARSAEGAYSRADQAVRLASLIEALGLKRSIVVGHSFGAGAVVELAMAHPDALAGMVLVDPVLDLPADGQSAASDRILRWALDQARDRAGLGRRHTRQSSVDTTASVQPAFSQGGGDSAPSRHPRRSVCPLRHDGFLRPLAAALSIARNKRDERDALGLREDQDAHRDDLGRTRPRHAIRAG